MPRLLLVALVAAATALGAAPARAAEVSLATTDQSAGKGPYPVDELALVDRDGVTDDLHVAYADGAVTVAGTPAPTPGPGCAAVAADAVRCVRLPTSDGGPVGGRVDLGAGDDRLDVTGADRLAVVGGPGADRLDVHGGRAGAVAWDGGPGADAVSGVGAVVDYGSRTAAVSVTFDGVANDGEPGEGDDAGTAGSATGGRGDDVLHAAPTGSSLVGGDGADVLAGGSGLDSLVGDGSSGRSAPGPHDDRLSGRGGADALDGGEGSDVLDGGEGDDRLKPGGTYAGPGDLDVTRGGPGRDAVDLVSFLRPEPVGLRLGSASPAAGVGVVQDVEDVTLGRRHAVLVGSDADERLELDAYSGSRLEGGGGDDVLETSGAGARRSRLLVGGPGRDAVRPGSAGDRLDLRDGEVDEATCSPTQGLLTTPRTDRADRLASCFAPMRMDPATAPLVRRELRVPVTCPRATRASCAGTMTLVAPSDPAEARLVRTTVRVRVPRGSTRRIVVRVGPATARRLRSARRRLGRVGFRVVLTRRVAGQAGAVRSEWAFDLRT